MPIPPTPSHFFIFDSLSSIKILFSPANSFLCSDERKINRVLGSSLFTQSYLPILDSISSDGDDKISGSYFYIIP